MGLLSRAGGGGGFIRCGRVFLCGVFGYQRLFFRYNTNRCTYFFSHVRLLVLSLCEPCLCSGGFVVLSGHIMWFAFYVMFATSLVGVLVVLASFVFLLVFISFHLFGVACSAFKLESSGTILRGCDNIETAQDCRAKGCMHACVGGGLICLLGRGCWWGN